MTECDQRRGGLAALRPVLLLVGVALGVAPASAGQIDFSRDVQPILADRCYACHGPDANSRKADLRLDQRSSAIASEAIVPGDTGASQLVGRILSEDPDEVMPPPKVNKPLTEQERRTLQAWIEQGAEYGTHWSFRPIKKPAGEGPQIDRLVRASLAEHGIEPAPEADRQTWLRRVS